MFKNIFNSSLYINVESWVCTNVLFSQEWRKIIFKFCLITRNQDSNFMTGDQKKHLSGKSWFPLRKSWKIYLIWYITSLFIAINSDHVLWIEWKYWFWNCLLFWTNTIINLYRNLYCVHKSSGVAQNSTHVNKKSG